MIGIISDIHGNYPALQAVLSRLDAMGVTDIICLGDIAGYYSQVNECCETLRQRNIFSLMGNHDWYLATGEGCPRSNSANTCLEYQRKVISSDNLEWLRTLIPAAEMYGIKIVHGGWNDPIDEYTRPSEKYFELLEGRYFASGHTHVPCVWSGLEKTYCNPGSVGQPRDGDPRASFAVFDGNGFNLYRTEYEIQRTQDMMSEAGFKSYFYENLTNGTRIGGGISVLGTNT
ncbi:metallophosphoesterase family protein [Nitrosomonas europaea]|uniref:metallophosphoesterase family protein n=1 Tax=Nitrosomonas europaea TaxID=915 RepID=UPI002CB0F425|nr:metallophosphoesterase family protein [Nitrosomonas europaea]HRN82799.1 metallophosphoesterase family protein [Nitrosomonas europaea]